MLTRLYSRLSPSERPSTRAQRHKWERAVYSLDYMTLSGSGARCLQGIGLAHYLHMTEDIKVANRDLIRPGLYDCAIIGGGPAGLSAALQLGRLRRAAIVIDDSRGRSTWHQINRNYLGFPDGIHATALRELGETQACQYGVRFLDARATDVHEEGAGREKRFTISTTAGDIT